MSDVSMPDIVEKPDQAHPADPSLEVNFALVLSRMIDSLQQDPAELRRSVYELARIKLYEQFGDKDDGDNRRLVEALETAIKGVETFALQQAYQAEAIGSPPKRALPGGEGIRGRGKAVRQSLDSNGAGFVVDSEIWEAPSLADGSVRVTVEPSSKTRPRSGALASVRRLLVLLAVVMAVGATVLYWQRLQAGLRSWRVPAVARSAPPPAQTIVPAIVVKPPDRQAGETRADPDLPLPTTFGIYAVNEGRLQELKPLVGRVPDPRVAMSTAISTPSETMLATGRIRFIVFRRDSATNAPDHADVRVIAKVRSAMGVDASGKAAVSAPRDSWVIRNLAIPYKIGPVDEHPEMYLLQPDTTDFMIPAGRYALVIKGQGYDFEVAGNVTDPRQCLERVDALNGAFFAPCPDKDLTPGPRRLVGPQSK